MRFSPGTQVWVRCEDGEWWPGQIREASSDLEPLLTPEGFDCCVEFYHHPGEHYPVRSTDGQRIQLFHADPSSRTREEAKWFQHPAAHAAIARALTDTAAVARPSLPVTTASPGTLASLSVDELRIMQTLLGAISGTAAQGIRQLLESNGADLSDSHVRRAQRRERKEGDVATRVKRRRTSIPASPPPIPPLPLIGESLSDVSAVPAPSHDSAPEASGHRVSTPEVEAPMPDETDDQPDPPSDEGTSPTVVLPADDSVLDVLRVDVFENTTKFVLSPIYKYVDVLGAVCVESESIRCTMQFSVPHMTRNPIILLLPIDDAYNHSQGWMEPVELEQSPTLSMTVTVNGHALQQPSNWRIPAGKEPTAVKAALSVDVTELVTHGPSVEELVLGVEFPACPDDLELWNGLLVVVLAFALETDELKEQLCSNYRSFNNTARRAAELDVTQGFVRLVCPLTGLPLENPVRSVSCEHLQCMELSAVLAQCVSTHVWNCPLCWAPMKPDDIWTNYRLKTWIDGHRRELELVEYIVETPPHMPLKVQYRSVEERVVEQVTDDDD